MEPAAAILVVDGDPLVRAMLVRLLEGVARVVAMSSAADAFRALDNPRGFDAFVLEIELADGDGLDVLAKARAEGNEAPALILTAAPAKRLIDRAFDLKAHYIVKPFALERIVRFVREAATTSTRARVDEMVASWQARYSLTPTEAEILLASANGASFDDLWIDRRITQATLRRHTHNIVAKTGDASLLSAVARLLRGDS